MSIVTISESIFKFLFSMKLKFSQPQMRYIAQFILGIMLCAGKRTVSEIQRTNLSSRHVSCCTRFLAESPWNHQHMAHQRIQYITDTLKAAKGVINNEPSVGFLLIDDTCCHKDTSTKHIEGLDFHYFHSEGKSVWSHKLFPLKYTARAIHSQVNIVCTEEKMTVLRVKFLSGVR